MVFKTIKEAFALPSKMSIEELQRKYPKVYDAILQLDKKNEDLKVAAKNATETYEESLNSDEAKKKSVEARGVEPSEEEKNWLRDRFDSAIAKAVPFIKNHGTAFKVACLGVAAVSGVASILSAFGVVSSAASPVFAGIAAGGVAAKEFGDFVEKVTRDIEMKRVEISSKEAMKASESRVLEEMDKKLAAYFSQPNASPPSYDSLPPKTPFGADVGEKLSDESDLPPSYASLSPKQGQMHTSDITHLAGAGDGEHHFGGVDLKNPRDSEGIRLKSIDESSKKVKEEGKHDGLELEESTAKRPLLSRVRGFFKGLIGGRDGGGGRGAE